MHKCQSRAIFVCLLQRVVVGHIPRPVLLRYGWHTHLALSTNTVLIEEELVEFPVGPTPEISEDSVLQLRSQEIPAMLRKSLIALTIFLGSALFIGGIYWGISG